jgi:phage repressor protein C with HTH and peptisase S24 domain
MFAIHRVSGESMSPELNAGDYVVLCIAPWFVSSPKSGEWLVFDHPIYGSLVKEVVQVNREQNIFLARGLNPQSISTMEMGEMPLAFITGKVLFRIRPIRFKNILRTVTDAK